MGNNNESDKKSDTILRDISFFGLGAFVGVALTLLAVDMWNAGEAKRRFPSTHNF